MKFPPIPTYHIDVKFSHEDDEKKKRVYLADTYHAAVAFASVLGIWVSIQAHNGGSQWKIEL